MSFWLWEKGSLNNSGLDFDRLVLQWNCAIAKVNYLIPYSCC